MEICLSIRHKSPSIVLAIRIQGIREREESSECWKAARVRRCKLVNSVRRLMKSLTQG